MAERIIPIQLEGAEGSPPKTPPSSQESEDGLSKSIEELQVKYETPRSKKTYAMASKNQKSKPQNTTKVVIKPAPATPRSQPEYLKEYNTFVKRQDNDLPSVYNYPTVNVTERIILVIDTAQDENSTQFTLGTEKCSPFLMLKRAIFSFIQLKFDINAQHQFAIIAMKTNCSTLISPFTSNCKDLYNVIMNLSPCETEDIFNLNTVFDIIHDLSLPAHHPLGVIPPYVVRTIIFYGRSYTFPQINVKEKFENTLNHPFFICDVLMTHEELGDVNNCQKIFDILQNLDKKGIAYFFPVGRDAIRMHKYMGKLLGHPFQRPIQKRTKS